MTPYYITALATVVVVTLGARGLGLGMQGLFFGAAFGLACSGWLGIVLHGIAQRRPNWLAKLAGVSVFLTIIATGVMLGGGIMYALLMTAAAAAPSGVLGAMMQPTIPFFMLLNTPLELLAVPGAIITNWANARRRLILIGAAAFYGNRIWSYLVYVPGRMDIASGPLSPKEIDWFQRTLALDYRALLVLAVFVTFTMAAFKPGARTDAAQPAS